MHIKQSVRYIYRYISYWSSNMCLDPRKLFSMFIFERLCIILPMLTEQSAAFWPPCVRVMVKESVQLERGSLYIITCSGASIGREKQLDHAIHIPDIQISKVITQTARSCHTYTRHTD